MINFWWVTRPKRDLTSIPEVLAVFADVALGVQWSGDRDLHRRFEDELERAGLKRVGARRDGAGSGGRTYQAWLSSLGLVFHETATDTARLTLAGEAIVNGKSPVEVLREQVMKFQFPSSFSLTKTTRSRVSERFHIKPFLFLLRLLCDPRVEHLSQEEIARIIITEAETEKSYEHIVNRLHEYRELRDRALPDDFIARYSPSTMNSEYPYRALDDTANTIINWLIYTQLVYREDGEIRIIEDQRPLIEKYLEQSQNFIDRPEDFEYFQRRYGCDPWHKKDTRNLLNTQTITKNVISASKVKQAFIVLSMKQPIWKIDTAVVDQIVAATGIEKGFVEDTLNKIYPHGAVDGFMQNYFSMAFQGRDEATDFENATTAIFHDVFDFDAKHLGQTGAKSAPDILLLSDHEGYQAVIDNKAYSKYTISGDHHNRMVYNYLKNIKSYSPYDVPIGFFSYISGGFGSQIDSQIKKIFSESGVHGSGITVHDFIELIKKHREHPFDHAQLRNIFGLDRRIRSDDF